LAGAGLTLFLEKAASIQGNRQSLTQETLPEIVFVSPALQIISPASTARHIDCCPVGDDTPNNICCELPAIVDGWLADTVCR
jgi:hypothetical protein